jgi:IS30 family transposase
MPKHININDRAVIDKMLQAGYQQKDIVLALNFSKGAISKEMKRNTDEDGVYRFKNANNKSKKRIEIKISKN